MKKTFPIILLCSIFFFCAAPSQFMNDAKLHIKQNQYDKAEEQLKLEIQSNPKNAKAYYWLGDIHRKRLEFNKMDAAFDSSLKHSTWYSMEIVKARKKAAILRSMEGKKIGLYPVVYAENNDENKNFAEYFSKHFHNQIKSIPFKDSVSIISSEKIIALLKEKNIAPTIIYDTPSKFTMMSFSAGQPNTRKDKELQNISDNILTPDILNVLSSNVDEIILCVIDVYNEVGSGAQVAQQVISGLLSGLAVSEKNNVVMNILICAKDGKLIEGSNEELRFEDESANGVEITRRELSEEICKAFLY